MKAYILPTEARPITCVPLTLTRDLSACTAANKTLRELQVEEITAAGLELVPTAPHGEEAVYLKGNAWVDREELEMLAEQSVPIVRDHGRNIAAFISSDGVPTPSNSLQMASDRNVVITHSWDLLLLNERLHRRVKENVLNGLVDEGVFVSGTVILGEGSHLLPGVFIEGTVIIGKNCKIGPNCYLRGPVSIGDDCHIGQAVEVKSSIIMDGSALGHLSYLGDSIVGTGVNFGAGTITANFRHDGKNHRSMVDGVLVDTGRRKFGAIIGDDVHTGIHTSIYPGRKLWPSTSTRPGDVVSKDLMGTG